MQTTLDLPDELYLAAKTQAAAQSRTVGDLVEQGLEIVLASPSSKADDLHEAKRKTLAALNEILRCPPSAEGRTRHLQNEVRSLRAEGWSRP